MRNNAPGTRPRTAGQPGTRRLEPWRDPNHEKNGAHYHTGKVCVEPGCDKPAGTWWARIWCFEHNVKRMELIDGRFEKISGAIA